MRTYRLYANNKCYGYYFGDTKYVALARAKVEFTWATLNDLFIYSHTKH